MGAPQKDQKKSGGRRHVPSVRIGLDGPEYTEFSRVQQSSSLNRWYASIPLLTSTLAISLAVSFFVHFIHQSAIHSSASAVIHPVSVRVYIRYIWFHIQLLSVAPPGFCNGGKWGMGSIGGLEYEVPQSRLYCLCINVALCSTALQCICCVIWRSSITMKAHTYYIISGRPPIGGKLPPSHPWRRHWLPYNTAVSTV